MAQIELPSFVQRGGPDISHQLASFVSSSLVVVYQPCRCCLRMLQGILDREKAARQEYGSVYTNERIVMSMDGKGMPRAWPYSSNHLLDTCPQADR